MRRIAAAAPSLPFYYYHIPAFNGAFLSNARTLESSRWSIPNFAGIKYTFESLYEYNQCRLTRMVSLICCMDRTKRFSQVWLKAVRRGGIGGTTNYNGRELTGIIEAWNKGDIETAREKQNFSQEVINVICHFRGNIVGGKRIMKLMGFDLGPNRVPFQNMTDEEEARMKKELEALRTKDGAPYKLIPLPLPPALHDEERPAYARHVCQLPLRQWCAPRAHLRRRDRCRSTRAPEGCCTRPRDRRRAQPCTHLPAW